MTVQRRREFIEKYGFLRQLLVGFRRMRAVVQADAEDLAGLGDAGGEFRVLLGDQKLAAYGLGPVDRRFQRLRIIVAADDLVSRDRRAQLERALGRADVDDVSLLRADAERVAGGRL